MNKNALIGGSLALLLLVAGAFFLLSRNNAEPVEDEQMIEEQIQTLKPEEIGLELEARADKKAVKFIVNKTEDIEKIEFDAIYKHRDNPGENIYDEIEIENPGEPYESKFYDLGTCSSGVCRYHVDVEDVKFIFKITKTDGNEYQVEEDLAL